MNQSFSASLCLIQMGSPNAYLEKQFQTGGEPDAMVLAALILLKYGSHVGINQLFQSLKDHGRPSGVIAEALAAAGIPGSSEAITDVLIHWPIGGDLYVARSLVHALRMLGTPVPEEVLTKLEVADRHIRKLL